MAAAERPDELAGYTIAITAERRREEFGAALERHGASVLYAPAIHIVPLADDSELRTATESTLAAPVDFVVATTGVGFRGWLEAADSWGLSSALSESLAASTLLPRGPKALGAIRAAGLREAPVPQNGAGVWPQSESSAAVLDRLLAEPELTGRRIAVQLHGDPMTDFVQALRDRGAEVIELPVYRWVPPTDGAPLRRLLELTVAAAIDCVAFTSAPAALSFLRTADELGLGPGVRKALLSAGEGGGDGGGVVAACVGSVTAAPLVEAGLPVIVPERGRLGSLVREIVEQVPRLRPRAAGSGGAVSDGARSDGAGR